MSVATIVAVTLIALLLMWNTYEVYILNQSLTSWATILKTIADTQQQQIVPVPYMVESTCTPDTTKTTTKPPTKDKDDNHTDDINKTFELVTDMTTGNPPIDLSPFRKQVLEYAKEQDWDGINNKEKIKKLTAYTLALAKITVIPGKPTTVKGKSTVTIDKKEMTIKEAVTKITQDAVDKLLRNKEDSKKKNADKIKDARESVINQYVNADTDYETLGSLTRTLYAALKGTFDRLKI